MVLCLGDSAGGGRWVRRGGRLQQWHGCLYKGNEVISNAWKCLLLLHILISSGAERAGGKLKTKRGGEGRGRGFKMFRSQYIFEIGIHSICEIEDFVETRFC